MAFLVASTLGHVAADAAGTGTAGGAGAGGAGAGSTLWFPPTGLALGFLLAVGPRGGAAVLAAHLLGRAVARPETYAGSPVAAVASDLVATLAAVLAAHLLRRSWTGVVSYAALTRFVVVGTVVAPVVAVTGGTLCDLLLRAAAADAAAWARAIIAQSTAVATLAPASWLLARRLLTGPAPAGHDLSAVTGRRRGEIVLQALAFVLLPALFVLGDRVSPAELVLVPLALLPLAWIAVDPRLSRALGVLAVCGLALGAAAELRFGNGPGTLRLQMVMFSGAVAALFAAAGLATQALLNRGAQAEDLRWQALLESAAVVVARVRADGRWILEPGSGGLAQVTGAEVVGHARTVPALADAIRSGLTVTVPWGPADDTGRRFVTRLTPLPDGETLVVTTETTRLHSAEVALAWERNHDRETDLPNRDLLVATAEQLLAQGRTASLVLLDVDHATRRAALLDIDPGRLVLVLAERVRGLVDPAELARGTALVARVGDDRFAVLLPEDVDAARQRADRMIRAVRAPVRAAGAPVAWAAWAGIAALDGALGAREALRRAEAALQAAAEQGRDQVVVLDDGLSVRAGAERVRLAGEVAHAVERGQLDVVFQPDVDLVDGRLTGVEALVRWRRHEGSAAPTETFVQLAEELGAVRSVDAWVLEESLRALGRWRGLFGADDLEMGVNVSAHSVTADLPDRLVEACLRHGVPPRVVRLEVTETALADDGIAVEVLRRVREQGFRVALDDFGTGYATLSRLQRLPVDVLKLDRSFLPSVARDAPSQALVALVLGLAGPLQVDVIVEGVETQEQREVLVALGCRRAQGYLFARPASASAVETMLASGTPLAPAAPSLA